MNENEESTAGVGEAPVCTTCAGSGTVDDGAHLAGRPCPTCSGTGADGVMVVADPEANKAPGEGPCGGAGVEPHVTKCVVHDSQFSTDGVAGTLKENGNG